MRARRDLIAAARHVQVRTAVPVRVEKGGAPVLIVLVSRPGLPLGRLDEAAVLALDEQFAGRSWGSADEHIVQSVTVHVRYREHGAVAGKLVGQERLYGVVGLRRGWRRVLQPPEIEWLERLFSGRSRPWEVGGALLLICIGLLDDQETVSAQTCKQLITPVG